jgi:hypothetical protein
MKNVRFSPSPSCRARLILAAALLSIGADASPARADDSDRFDGAVWNFVMTPKRRGPEPLKGGFRVFNHVLYQRSTPRGEFDREIGKNVPKGKRTRVEMKDFRAFDNDRNLHSGLTGNALLTMDRAGEWSGTLIDSEGRHWDFRCTRVQE